MEVNDYSEPDSRSPLIDWLVGLGIPFVCAILSIAIESVPDRWTYYIKVGSV